MNRRPILLLSEIFPPTTGGSGRWLWEVYRRLPREAVYIAAGKAQGAAEFDGTHDVRVERLSLSLGDWGVCSPTGCSGYRHAYKVCKTIVARERPAAIHAARCLPEGGIAWLLKQRYRIPYLCYVHGEEVCYAESSRELSFLTRRVLRGASCVIANSRNSRQMLVKRWRVPVGKVRVLHPGVDSQLFVPAERCEATREALGWQGRSVVLTVGRLQKRKGHDQLIRALPAIRQSVPNMLYSIVGAGEERSNLEQLVQELGLQACVQFRGEPNDAELIRCYQQCDLFVLPNRQVGQDIEGFGMVLIEAQACGKPVLAGASGGTAETMHIPETGWVLPCEGPEKLAIAVVELLSDELRREAMSVAARRWAVERFDWESLCQQAVETFDSDGDGRWASRTDAKRQATLSPSGKEP